MMSIKTSVNMQIVKQQNITEQYVTMSIKPRTNTSSPVKHVRLTFIHPAVSNTQPKLVTKTYVTSRKSHDKQTWKTNNQYAYI